MRNKSISIKDKDNNKCGARAMLRVMVGMFLAMAGVYLFTNGWHSKCTDIAGTVLFGMGVAVMGASLSADCSSSTKNSK